jgi:hypothetical protein
MGRCLRDPQLHREDLQAKGLDVPPGDELPAPTVHYVQLFAALVLTGVGVIVAVNALRFSSGGLVPQLLLPDSSLAVRGFLLARPLARRWGRAILGGLLTPPTDSLRELLDLAAISGAVMGGRVKWA